MYANNKFSKKGCYKMGKKKKKKISSGSGMYDQERNKEIADHLEAYIDAVDSLFILEGKS